MVESYLSSHFKYLTSYRTADEHVYTTYLNCPQALNIINSEQLQNGARASLKNSKQLAIGGVFTVQGVCQCV